MPDVHLSLETARNGVAGGKVHVRRARPGAFGPGLVAAGYVALQVLGRRAGSTSAERAARLPGDELVPEPQLVTDHAVTIAAPPEQAWPWLTQMGWHLGGYDTPAWVDRLLFPANRPSLDRIDPELQRTLVPGDVIPDGPPGTAEYVVDRLDLVPAAAIDVRRTHATAPARDQGAGGGRPFVALNRPLVPPDGGLRL